MRLSLVLAVAGALMLAGCNGGRDDENVPDENVTTTPNEGANDAASLNRSEGPKNVAAPENRMEPPQFSDEQQIQDDAEASGMTSRLPDENVAVPSAETGAAASSRDAPGQR